MNTPPHRKWLVAVVCCVLILAAAHTAQAQLPVPTNLQPGDAYHLIFNSSLSTTAFSTDIGFYNVVAQAAADVAGIGVSQGVTWRALGSTGSINASENAVVSAPIYNMNGELVATGYDDLE